MLDGILEPQEALLGCQRSRTSYFFGPEILSVVYFPLNGLSRPPQEPHIAFSSLAQDLVSAQDRQGAEVGEEDGSLGAWTC